ncbi:MAG: amidohydrolase family protein, partial [Tissierellia bacterium]|nr:amidohydrolase family protein [Tissierellia bacterium]
GVEDGLVDTIGTDNVTLTRAEKNIDASIWDTIPGYSALETHLPILLHEGVVKRNIPIEKVISKVTKNPAETFNVYPKKGTISPGSDADIVIVDLNISKEIKAQDLSSRSDFSIYENRVVKGWPVTTIKAGKVVIRDGEFVANGSNGVYISR